jgi:FtsP/CotA-like multicopper oxidase with cupredoxin domain
MRSKKARSARVLGIVGAVLTSLLTLIPGGPGAASADQDLGKGYPIHSADDVSRDPKVFETTLVAEEARTRLADGVIANTYTYNGTVPGPEIAIQAGDTVLVHFRNELPESTGIHWHGMELNNASDGTSLTQNDVEPGGSFLYRFIAPRPGVYWYHPHHSPTNQVFRGLYGSLIVTDPNEETLVSEGVLPPAEATKTLVVSDTTVCNDVGENDAATYPADPTFHWAGGPSYPGHAFPSTPRQVCETSPLGIDGHPVFEPLGRGDIPNIQPSQHCDKHQPGCRVNEGQLVLANGRVPAPRAGSPDAPAPLLGEVEALEVSAGQGIRLQIINASVLRFFRLRLTDSTGRQIPLYRIGGQGGLLDQVRLEGGVDAGYDSGFGSGEILLPPASRADVVAVVPADATGVATLWTLDYQRAPDGIVGIFLPRNGAAGWASLPTLPVAHLEVDGIAREPFEIGVGDALLTHPSVNRPVEDLSDDVVTEHLLDREPGTPSEQVRLTMNPPAGIFPSIETVKGQHHHGTRNYFAGPDNETTRWGEAGDVLELQVANTSGFDHTFHLHGFSIQPLRLLNQAGVTIYTFPYREFVDNPLVRAGHTLVFRLRLTERPLMDGQTSGGPLGRWVFHCHMFPHASLGMISELVVVAPEGRAPLLDQDRALVRQGDKGTATNAGKYFDADGDAVTLKASVGSLVAQGDGTWSWEYRPTGDEGLRPLVYITATDSSGLSNQIAFRLASGKAE